MTTYQATLQGASALVMNSLSSALDKQHPLTKQISAITAKSSKNRTDTDLEVLRGLSVLQALWLDGPIPAEDDGPLVPHVQPATIRSAIEGAARLRKEGPLVRRGLAVVQCRFHYDTGRYGTTKGELMKSADFTVPVRQGQQSVLRTRAQFDTPWSVDAEIVTFDDEVDEDRLARWLTVAGQAIGIGDWRPQKSGSRGRFTLDSLEACE